MKIKKSELVQIIKEEAVKVKKVKLLEAEKAQILSTLNEIYEGDEVEESFLGMGKKNSVSKEDALNIINGHPARRAVYQQALSKFPERAPKYVEFFMKNSNVKSVKWDKAKQQYVDAMAYSSNNSPGIAGAAAYNEGEEKL